MDSYFKVDPKKIVSLVHEKIILLQLPPDLNTKTMEHKVDALHTLIHLLRIVKELHTYNCI